MGRNVALVLGLVLILAVGAVTIAVSNDDGPVASTQTDDRFESVVDEDGDLLDDIVGTLDVDPVEILEALADGATLAEVIEDNGGDPDEIVDALEAMADEAIDDALTDGTINEDEADELRGFVADTVDGLMNLPIGVLFRDLGLLGGLAPGVPFEALPEDLDELRGQLEEQFGEEFDDGEFRFGPFFEEGSPFDLDALPEDLPDEVRELLERLRGEFESIDPEDLLEGFDGGFFFDEGEIPEDLRRLFEEFGDGFEFRLENPDANEEAA